MLFTQQGALCCLLLTEYYSVDKIKENEMRRINGTCGKRERCIESFGGEI
jgi:hypothetical protein